MHFQTSAYICLLALYLMSSLDESIASSLEVHANWTKLSNQLFGPNQPDLEPTKVLELLKEASQVFELLNKPLSSEEEKKAIKMKTLLKFSNLDMNDCNLESLKLVTTLTKSFSLYHQHLRHYVEHFQSKKYEACKPNLISSLKVIVEKYFPEEQRRDLDLIVAKIKSSKPEANMDSLYLSVPDESLLEGLLLFLDHKEGQLNLESISDKKNGFNNYETMFERSVLGVCRAVDLRLKKWLSIYNQLILDEDIADEMDEFSMNWLIKGRICNEIMERDLELAEQTYELLMRKNIKAHRWGHLFS